MTNHYLFEAECLAVLRELPTASFDAGLSDPPYGIEFLGLGWDRVLPPVEVWQEFKRVLKPGSPALVFAHPKAFHRMGCRLEDAGLEVVDTLCWLYGQGMPKSDALTKPGWEPIFHVRAPGPPRELNIDGCRLGERYPSNVILFEEAAEALDAQAGERRSGAMSPDVQRSTDGSYSGRWGGAPITAIERASSAGGASRFFYCPKVKGFERKHPTQKPVELTEWLARLLLPPGGGGRLVVPYAGVGSEMLGGTQAGWGWVVGIEREPGYCADARERLGIAA